MNLGTPRKDLNHLRGNRNTPRKCARFLYAMSQDVLYNEFEGFKRCFGFRLLLLTNILLLDESDDCICGVDQQ